MSTPTQAAIDVDQQALPSAPVCTAPYTLHFREWRCGHHGERPADIPVDNPAQAALILQAISHAISQPGHARAVLMTDARAIGAYITDDYVAIGPCSQKEFPELLDYQHERPIVIIGTPEELDEIHSPALNEALEDVFGPVERWDGKATCSPLEIVTTTLSQAEVERIAAPIEWHEDGERHEVFEMPPVYRTAADVLAELRDVAESIAQEAA